jgi:hypothetical protein
MGEVNSEITGHLVGLDIFAILAIPAFSVNTIMITEVDAASGELDFVR